MAGIDNYFSSLNISVSGMKAERIRMDVVMSNLANTNSTRTAEGGPYRRRQVVFQTLLDDAENSGGFGGRGVEVSEISLDNSDFVRVYRPGHPDADADGYVSLPNINSAEEMADLLSASRSHEANSAAFRVTKDMFRRALEIGRT
jgi:flagellar basal-body rod protein FlgC